MATQRAAGSWRTLDTLFNVGTLGALSDGELLERFRNGRDQESEDAFRTLVERYGPMILSLCRSMLKDAHEADDAFQATFLVLVQRARSMQHHETLGPWLYAVASRVGRRARTRLFRRRQRERPAVAEIAANCSSSECHVEEQVIRLLVRETGISESVTTLAREVNRSLLFPISKLAGLVALLSAGVLGTVVLAQQQANRLAETTSRPSTRSVVSSQEKAANPGQPADKIRALSPRQQFEALLTREEDHLKKIQSLKCIIDLRSTLDGGKTWKHNSTLQVWKRGPIERVHRSTRSVRAIGAGSFDEIPSPQGEVDVLLTPDAILSMQGFDPTHPPTEPVTVRDELMTGNKIGGLIQPAAAFGPGGYQHALAADFLMLLLPGFQHSLRDLYKDSANSGVKPVERRGPQGETLWDLDLKTSNGRTSFVLTLSPRHGYSIIEEKGMPFGALGTESTRVLEFQEPVPGVFLAKLIQSRYTQKPELIVETRIHDVEINGPIADKELSFRFLKGIGVGDVAKKVHYIWGGGAPAQTFSTEEYNEWRQREMKKARGIATE